MRNIFLFPKPLQDLFATTKANRWQVLLPYSAIFLALGFLGTATEAATSVYEFPLLDLYWLITVWFVAIVGARLCRTAIVRNPALTNLTIWLAASFLGVAVSMLAVWFATGEPIPAEILSSVWLRILVGFVNLGAYLVIISAVLDYREISRMLRRELARLVTVRAAITESVMALKASYSAEVDQKMAPVLTEIQLALREANADAVVSQARTAIEKVVLPLSGRIADGSLNLALGALPELPSRRLKLRQFFDSKVNLQHAFVPVFTGFVFSVSILPAFDYFYGNAGLLAGLLSLAIILLGQLLISIAFKNRILTPGPALISVIVSSAVIAAIAGLSIQLIVAENSNEVDAFLTLGTWLVVFLNSLIQLVNTLTLNYLDKLASVQSDYARALQKRELEISQLQRRVTSVIHGDVQGKLRAILLRVKTGGLTAENLSALEADLAHVQNASNLLSEDQPIDFFDQVRGLKDFWAGVSEIEVESSLEAAELLAGNPNLSAAAFEVLSEAVANALKHAEAEQVNVSLTAGGQVLEIQVFNSLAKGLAQNPTSGVGSRIFDQLCDSYSVRADEHEYRLIASVKS